MEIRTHGAAETIYGEKKYKTRYLLMQISTQIFHFTNEALRLLFQQTHSPLSSSFSLIHFGTFVAGAQIFVLNSISDGRRFSL